MAVDGIWGSETEDAIQQALAARSPATEGDEVHDATAAPPQRSSMRIIGGIVAGLAISGIAAAILITRQRRATPEAHDDLNIGSLHDGRLRLQGLVMARGEYRLEVIEAGEVLVFALAYGCL